MVGVFAVTAEEYEEILSNRKKLEKLEAAIKEENNVVRIDTKLLSKALELGQDSTFVFTM